MGALKFDPEKRVRELARLRREQAIAESELTPAERLERASELARFGAESPDAPVTPPGRPKRRGRG